MYHKINLEKKDAYSNDWTSSTMLMRKQSSSIKSEFVGLKDGERPNDSDRGSTSDDSIKLAFVGSRGGKSTNDGDTSLTFDDDFDNFVLLGGSSRIIQSVGSVLSSSSRDKSRFLMSSLFNFESTNITANVVLKFIMCS
jgi:hypothetical protein